MAEVDSQGGIVKLVSDGAVQSQVSAQAYKFQRDLESGAFRKVGVNCYRVDEEEEHDVQFHPYRDEDVSLQVESLNRIRKERDASRVAAMLERVGTDARADRNVMPAIMEAVKAYASVGEITDELVKNYGRYQEPVRF